MAYYRVKFKAETWKVFKSGELSVKATPLAVDTEFYGTIVGRQNVSEHVIVQLGTLYTKFMWLSQIPNPAPPPPPPPPEPVDPDFLTAHYPDGTTKKYVPE